VQGAATVLPFLPLPSVVSAGAEADFDLG